MLLIPVQEVLDRITFDDIGDVERAVAGAIRSTTRTLEGALRTRFDRAARTDTYRITRTYTIESYPLRNRRLYDARGLGLGPDVPLSFVPLLLSSGFVDLTVTGGIQIYSADTIANLDDAALRNDLTDIEGADRTLTDPERGVVMLDGLFLTGTYVRVIYESGLYENSDELADGVPSWLHEAAYLRTVISLDSNPVIRREDATSAQTEELGRQLRDIFEDHVRYEPLAAKPIFRG